MIHTDRKKIETDKETKIDKNITRESNKDK